MKDFFIKAVKAFLNRNFILFCLLGFINTFNTSVISLLSNLLIEQENISAVIGYILSLQGAYLLSCRYIFEEKPTFNKYKRFLISYIPSFVVYVLVHAGAFSALGLNQFWATFVAVMLSGPLTFFIIKAYAFGKGSMEKNDI